MRLGPFLARIVAAGLALGLAGCGAPPGAQVTLSPYPDAYLFAFTITDDPDGHRLEKIRPVYDFLTALGMRTSVGVFTREADRVDGFPDRPGHFDYGDTTERPAYRDYILELQRRGFEVFLHTASGGNDLREETIAGYDAFSKIFRHDPLLNLMHSSNLENVYWGSKAVGGWAGYLVGLVYAKANYPFAGDDPSSPYFWGDVLQRRSKYVRLWGTSAINTLGFNPSMPYHDPATPYVNYWFSFSDGPTARHFLRLIRDRNIAELVREHGASIVYAHLADGFAHRRDNGSCELDPEFRDQMIRLVRQPRGWFVPAGQLLDRLLLMKNVRLAHLDDGVVIANANTTAVEGVSLFAPPSTILHDCRGRVLPADEHGTLVVGALGPGASVALYRSGTNCGESRSGPGGLEYANMVLQRVALVVKHRWEVTHGSGEPQR